MVSTEDTEELLCFTARRWPFFSPSLTLSFDSPSRWPQWHEWNRKEVPPPPSTPPCSVIGRGGRLPPMIRPSAEIVPGKLLSCTSVMLCSPGYLHLISVTEAAVCLSHTENTQDKTSLAGSACYIFNLVS